MKKVIVISAHPDDETLGVGGTILKHVSNNDEVYWLIITKAFEEQGFEVSKIDLREKEIDAVASRYGFSGVFKLDYPTMSLSSHSLGKLIPQISNIFNTVEPEIIYTPNRSDAHSDHRILFEAVAACTKSFRYQFVKQFLMYECISETEFAPALPEKTFLPNYFVDISEFIDEKLKIMELYESEIGEHPFPRSICNIKALAHFRGATIAVHYAEAFQLLKYIDK